MITRELINKIYPFFASLSIITGGLILVFFALSKRKGFKIFGIAAAAVSIVTAIILNIRTFGMFGDFSSNLFSFNFFTAATTTVILFAALNILIYVSVINFQNDNFIKILLIFLAGVFFFTIFISANNFIMIFTSFSVLLMTVFQLSSVLSSRINKGSFSEYSIKNSIIRFYLAAAFSFLLTFMGYSLIFGSTDLKSFKQLVESDSISDPLVVTGLFIIFAGLYVFLFIFPFQSAYIKMQNRIQYSSMQVVWFFYFPAGFIMFLKLKDVLAYFLSKQILSVSWILLAISAICVIGGNIGAIKTQSLRRILSFLYLSMTGQILLGFAQFGLGALSNSRVVWLAVANILFMGLIYFPLGLFSSELENRSGSDKITNMAGYLRTQKFVGINILILLLAFGGLIGTAGYVLRFMYVQPFLAGFKELLSIGSDVRLSVLNISSFAVMLVSWLFIAVNVIRLIFCLAKSPRQSGQTKTSDKNFGFSRFLCGYLTFFSVIIILSGIMGLLEILGVNLSFLNFSLINLNF